MLSLSNSSLGHFVWSVYWAASVRLDFITTLEKLPFPEIRSAAVAPSAGLPLVNKACGKRTQFPLKYKQCSHKSFVTLFLHYPQVKDCVNRLILAPRMLSICINQHMSTNKLGLRHQGRLVARAIVRLDCGTRAWLCSSSGYSMLITLCRFLVLGRVVKT